MQVPKTNTNFNPQFKAIFKLDKNTKTMCEMVINSVKECTVPEEALKIENKFDIGGGSLYVYVPNENLQKLKNLLSRRIAIEAVTEFLTRVD